MLVPSKDLLEKAQKEGYAVPQFNTSNLEITKAIINVASKLQSPIILATSEGEMKFFGPRYMVVIAKVAAKEAQIPLALHLDHGKSLKSCLEALDVGYSSVHIDGSELPFSENIALTLSIVEVAQGIGASVEGELGIIPKRDYEEEVKSQELLTDPQKAADFALETGIDSLAVAIGTTHGAYKQQTKINFERLAEIKQKVKIPLVLHGGSLVSEDEIKKAILKGICKININTELRLAYTNTLRKVLDEQVEEYVPYKIFPEVLEALEKIVEQKIKLFGSANKG